MRYIIQIIKLLIFGYNSNFKIFSLTPALLETLKFCLPFVLYSKNDMLQDRKARVTVCFLDFTVFVETWK